MKTKTFEFTAPNADEYKLLEAGIMRMLFIPTSQIPREELYDEDDKPIRFETVIVKSPSGKKSLQCDHLLTDICPPGYSKDYTMGKSDYAIKAVQHMYRVHVKLKTEEDEPQTETATQDAD